MPSSPPYSFQFDAWPTDLMGRWSSNSSQYAVGAASQSYLTVPTHGFGNFQPLLLKGLRVKKFQTTFQVQRQGAGTLYRSVDLVFNAGDQDDYDYMQIFHSDTQTAPAGYKVTDGGAITAVSGTGTAANMPTLTSTSVLWAQVTFDGTTLTVKGQAGATEPTIASWSGVSACYTSTNFRSSGGMMGFSSDLNDWANVSAVKVWSATAKKPQWPKRTYAQSVIFIQSRTKSRWEMASYGNGRHMMGTPLEYAGPTGLAKTMAAPAMICGLCSGPVGFGLAFICSLIRLDEKTEALLMFLAVGIPMAGALVFGCVARSRLPAGASKRDRRFAYVGISAPIGWGLAFFLWFIYEMNISIY